MVVTLQMAEITAELMKTAGMNTLLGMGTVFIVLILIMALISCFKFIGNIGQKPAKKEEPKQTSVDKAVEQLAAKIICDGQGADAIDACAKEYDALQNSVDAAAARGYVDTIIAPADTRKYLIGAFDMLYTKAVDTVAKKHGAVL